MKSKNFFVFAIVLTLVVVGIFLISTNKVSSFDNVKSFEGDMTIYKSSTCGCCEIYSSYFKSKGNKNVEVVDISSNSLMMEKYNIPNSLESCHTTIIGNYFVEGHIPLEAIEKLITEKPDIAGIGMPGMPNGSPGMPGQKSGSWIIYGVNHDGSMFEFMRI